MRDVAGHRRVNGAPDMPRDDRGATGGGVPAGGDAAPAPRAGDSGHVARLALAGFRQLRPGASVGEAGSWGEAADLTGEAGWTGRSTRPCWPTR